jgi:hypothetical protein
LLDELKSHDRDGTIQTIQGDFLNPEHYFEKAPFVLAICMGDMLLHLSSKQAIADFVNIAANVLEFDGKLILSFRDLSVPLTGTDRFIPVHNDQNKIMTCFLEYKPDFVLVHDLIYQKNGNEWELKKSAYKKVRISVATVKNLLEEANFDINSLSLRQGMAHIIATKC